MQQIDHFNLRSFDLNLMLAFDALMAERSVTRAAQRLRIKQPAMSHALASLRLLLGDELLVRVGTRMEPTARAAALIAPIRELLIAAQGTLLARPVFDPATEQRTFRLGLSDQLEALLLPPLLARLRREAPGLIVRTRPTSRDTVFDDLEGGLIDVAVGSFDGGPAWVRRHLLYSEEHVCCFHPAHLDAGVPLSRRDYDTAAHAFLSRAEAPLGYLGEALAGAKVQPSVAATTTNFFNLLLIASEAPLMVTVPRRLAERFAGELGLAISPPPFGLPTYRVDSVWHQRVGGDAGLRWLRDVLVLGASILEQETI